jgi:hypothetical protein
LQPSNSKYQHLFCAEGLGDNNSTEGNTRELSVLHRACFRNLCVFGQDVSAANQKIHAIAPQQHDTEGHEEL